MAVRAPAVRPAGVAWPLKSQDPPATPGAPHAQEQAERRHQSSSLHATLHVISDARGRDCDHTPNSTKPCEEERPGGGAGRPAGQATGGPPRHSPQAAAARAPCSSLRTRRRQRLLYLLVALRTEGRKRSVVGGVRFGSGGARAGAGVRGAPLFLLCRVPNCPCSPSSWLAVHVAARELFACFPGLLT